MSAKDASGKRARVEILDGGKFQAGAVIGAMRTVLKDARLDKLAQLTQEFDKHVMAVDTLQSQIQQKKDMAKQARSQDKVAVLEAQIVEIEKSLQAAQAKLDACQAKLTVTNS